MTEEVDHVYVEEEDFDSAVMESPVESDIDDIRGYSAEDLRCKELGEAAAALW